MDFNNGFFVPNFGQPHLGMRLSVEPPSELIDIFFRLTNEIEKEVLESCSPYQIEGLKELISTAHSGNSHKFLDVVTRMVGWIRDNVSALAIDKGWIEEILYSDNVIRTLSENERLARLLFLRVIIFNVISDDHPTPLEVRFKRERAEYLSKLGTGVLELREILEKLKESLKNNPRNQKAKRLKSFALWEKLIPGYVSLHRQLNELKLKKMIWIADPDADINAAPKVEPGTLDLVEDITDFITRCGDLPTEVLDMFKTAVKTR